MRKPRICFECGSKQISQSNLKGMKFPWRDHSAIELRDDFYANQCEKCGELFFHAGQTSELDKLLEHSIVTQMQETMQSLKRHHKMSQKDVAAYLKVSVVYMSQILNGSRTVSASLFERFVTLSKVSPFELLSEVSFEKAVEFYTRKKRPVVPKNWNIKTLNEYSVRDEDNDEEVDEGIMVA